MSSRRLPIRLLPHIPKPAFFSLAPAYPAVLWAVMCLVCLLPGTSALGWIPPSLSIPFVNSLPTAFLFFIRRPHVPACHYIHWVNEGREFPPHCPALLLVILLILPLVLLKCIVCRHLPVPHIILICDPHIKHISRPTPPEAVHPLVSSFLLFFCRQFIPLLLLTVIHILILRLRLCSSRFHP